MDDIKYLFPIYQPHDTPYLVQRFCILCRAFFPGCELDIPGDGTVYVTFGTAGFAEMYPSVNPACTQYDPGEMLMILQAGEPFGDAELLWSGYDEDKFTELLKHFNRDPVGTTKFYVRKNKKAEYAAKRRHAKRRME